MKSKTAITRDTNLQIPYEYDMINLFIRRNDMVNRNGWFYIGTKTQIYLRKTKRFIGEQYSDFIDIPNIITPPKEQGKGTFDRFLNYLQNTLGLNVYVENVHNERLAKALVKRGFQNFTQMGYELCYYKFAPKK